ncbi:hypothetical protein V8C34DRAFT_286353 [Trichoderma compactum]
MCVLRTKLQYMRICSVETHAVSGPLALLATVACTVLARHPTSNNSHGRRTLKITSLGFRLLLFPYFFNFYFERGRKGKVHTRTVELGLELFASRRIPDAIVSDSQW